MEWAMNNPGHFIFYVVMISAVLVSIIIKRRSKHRNGSSSCAKCGQQFKDDHYYAYRMDNYCSSCISLMRSNAKKGVHLILGMIALAVIFLAFGFLQDYRRGFINEASIYSWFKIIGKGALTLGLVYLFVARDYKELRKADNQSQKTSTER